MAWVTIAPSEAMRSASQGGTRPPCSGRSALPVRRAIEVLGAALEFKSSKQPGGYNPMSLQRMQARRQRKLETKRQPGDLGGLGCAPTNRPLVALARCRINGFRIEGGLDTSADW